MSDPFEVHLDDQMDGVSSARSRRTARFYQDLRSEGVPRWLAGVLTALDLAGYHFSPPFEDEE